MVSLAQRVSIPEPHGHRACPHPSVTRSVRDQLALGRAGRGQGVHTAGPGRTGATIKPRVTLLTRVPVAPTGDAGVEDVEEGQVARSKQEHGRYILLILYRVSQTHRGASQFKKFRSSDVRWTAGGRASSWPTAEEAMTHAQSFTQFVQRGFAHAGCGGSHSSINSSTPPSFAAASASPSRRSKRPVSRLSAEEPDSDPELLHTPWIYYYELLQTPWMLAVRARARLARQARHLPRRRDSRRDSTAWWAAQVVGGTAACPTSQTPRFGRRACSSAPWCCAARSRSTTREDPRPPASPSQPNLRERGGHAQPRHPRVPRRGLPSLACSMRCMQHT